MDPFSGESELLPITTAFYTHAYQTVISYDTTPLSAQNKPQAQILRYRAQIALGQITPVTSALSNKKDAASRALLALAQNDLSSAQQLAESSADNEDPTVQICAGTVLAKHSEYAAAIDLLSKHQGSLEAVALLVQIHLQQNRTDLAIKEVAGAKRWAQDSLLINLAEAWVNLRVGGSEKYQSAYYVFEELASAPGSQSKSALVNQAVAEMHLGRVEESEVALNTALEGDDVDVQAVANAVVLQYVIGKGSEEKASVLKEQLRGRDPEHVLLTDVAEKERMFDVAAAKYAPKVAS